MEFFLPAIDACKVLGITFNQWRTAIWAYHTQYRGTNLHWMPLPVAVGDVSTELTSKYAYFRVADIGKLQGAWKVTRPRDFRFPAGLGGTSRRELRRQLRICLVCREPASEGFVYCEGHRQHRLELRRRSKEENWAKGLCACGQARSPNRKTCDDCRTRAREANRRWNAQQLGRTTKSRSRQLRVRMPITRENFREVFFTYLAEIIPKSARKVPKRWREDYVQDIYEKVLGSEALEKLDLGQPSWKIYSQIALCVVRHTSNWLRTYQRRLVQEIPTDPEDERFEVPWPALHVQDSGREQPFLEGDETATRQVLAHQLADRIPSDVVVAGMQLAEVNAGGSWGRLAFLAKIGAANARLLDAFAQDRVPSPLRKRRAKPDRPV